MENDLENKAPQRFLVTAKSACLTQDTIQRRGSSMCSRFTFSVRKQETPLIMYCCIVIQPGRFGHNFCMFFRCSE